MAEQYMVTMIEQSTDVVMCFHPTSLRNISSAHLSTLESPPEIPVRASLASTSADLAKHCDINKIYHDYSFHKCFSVEDELTIHFMI